MKLKVEPLPIPAQAWVDTLDYHVRRVVEQAGESFDAWTVHDGSAQSADLSPETLRAIEDALKDTKLVSVTRIP